MGHQRTDLFVAMLHEYGNYISQDSYETSPPNLTQLHLYGRRCHSAAKPSQGTGGRSSGWGVYTVSCPATWMDEHCRESTSRQWKLQPMLLCPWSLGFVFWRELQEVCHPDKFGVLFPVLSDSRLTGRLDRWTGPSWSSSLASLGSGSIRDQPQTAYEAMTWPKTLPWRGMKSPTKTMK